MDEGLSRSQIQDATNQILGVHNCSFDVKQGEILVLMGLSGSGKSTLLRGVNGLNPVCRGAIHVYDGDNLVNVTQADAATLRNIRLKQVAMVFQQFGLFPWRSVRENVGLGLELGGVPKAEIHTRVTEQLELVGLADWSERKVSELSGGMQQRVGIARAFISNADVLLLDEPFGSLDAQSRTLLQEELLRIWGDQKKLVIHVTHDIEESLLLGDRVLVMTGRPGSIREDMQVPIRRPRTMESRNQSDFLELKQHIWELLEEEVRENLRIKK